MVSAPLSARIGIGTPQLGLVVQAVLHTRFSYRRQHARLGSALRDAGTSSAAAGLVSCLLLQPAPWQCGPSKPQFHRAHSVVRHKTNGTMCGVAPVGPAGAQGARNEMVILLCEKLLAADAMLTCKLTEKTAAALDFAVQNTFGDE